MFYFESTLFIYINTTPNSTSTEGPTATSKLVWLYLSFNCPTKPAGAYNMIQ